MSLESDTNIKTDEEIVATLIQDTVSDKIYWESNDVYITGKLKVNEDISIIFRISDQRYEEEVDEYTSRYQNLEINAHEIVLTLFMKKRTLKSEIFIKKINTSQMQLLYLIDHAVNKLKK